jgi:hypothetical protein
MTSLEKALTDALDQAWVKYDENGSDVAFPALYRAVKLLAGLAIHQEARSLPPGLPQEPPAAPAGTNPPTDWESVAKRQQMVIRSALAYLRLNDKASAMDELGDAL